MQPRAREKAGGPKGKALSPPPPPKVYFVHRHTRKKTGVNLQSRSRASQLENVWALKNLLYRTIEACFCSQPENVWAFKNLYRTVDACFRSQLENVWVLKNLLYRAVDACFCSQSEKKRLDPKVPPLPLCRRMFL